MIETLVEIEHIEDFTEQGFYSKSYKGQDLRLNRIVAVKDIHSAAVESKESVEKYFEEAQRLSLAAHPRILPVYFVGLDKSEGAEDHFGTPRIVTKYIKGGSLNQLLNSTFASRKTLEIGASIRYIHDIIQGMIHLHSLDILHLDLKASNIFIGDDKKLILADFGQSKMINDESLVRLDNLYPSILTPEAIRKKVGDKTTDIYQFGVLLYSIFNYDIYRNEIETNYKVNTGILNKLFNGEEDVEAEQKEEFKENMKRLTTDIKGGVFPNRDLNHYYVPKVIQEIIRKCLEPQVADRYQNFYQIQAELNKLNTTNKVQDLVQNLDFKRIEFSKLGINCYLDVEEAGNRYNLSVFKNNRAKNALNKDNMTRLQLSGAIQTAINDI